MVKKRRSSNSEKQIEGYLRSHPMYNASIHLLGGIGIGILLTNPFFEVHPVKWAAFFLLLALLGHTYPIINRK